MVMNLENNHGSSPEVEGRHVRTPQEVLAMQLNAERAAAILKISERLGGASVATTVERPDPEALARLKDRLEG